MEYEGLVEQLGRLEDEELIHVLQRVFASRVPYPDEASFLRSRFFLGVATSELGSDDAEPEKWGPWEVVDFPTNGERGVNGYPARSYSAGDR